MGALRRLDLARMAWRASLLQATWNYERQQGVGWAYAIAPALERLIPDAAARRERLAEHTAYFNTQPTLASLALGVVAALEERRAADGTPDAESVAHTKAVLGSTLAALGDRLFWFTLRPFAAVLGVLVAMVWAWPGALVLWVCYNILHLGLRFAGVGWGYAHGPAAVGETLRRRIGGLVWFLQLAGTAVIGATVAWALAPGGQPLPVVQQVALGAGLLLGMLGAQRARPSPTEWALGLGVACIVVTWFR
jgi:mannose/fructose/N-acetylgalactosamine-specific phosphotransferase system component IID